MLKTGGDTGEEEEEGGHTPENLYNFCFNDSVNHYDVHGESIIGPVSSILRGIAQWLARFRVRQLAKKIAECEAIHAAYKALNCKGCNDCVYREEAEKRAACLTAEIAGRERYLKKKCDYVLPGSIARPGGSAAAEAGHRIEVANKKQARNKCIAKALTLPPTPTPPNPIP